MTGLLASGFLYGSASLDFGSILSIGQDQIVLSKMAFLVIVVLFLTILTALGIYYLQSQQKWKKLNQELESYIDSNIKLEQFAHIASHDLQSPVRTVRSFTGLLKKRLHGNAAEDVNRYLLYVENAAKQMESLTTDLLHFAKVNSMEVELSKFNTREMIQNVLDLQEYEITQSRAMIIMANMPEYIQADKGKLQRVFHNLLSNSLKFTKEGITPRVEIGCCQKGDFFEFSISDNGIGISKKFYSQIFANFAKLNTQEAYEGSGLGLAMAHKIITNHGGNISVTSAPDQGSIFSFTIPRNGLEISYDAKKELLTYQVPSFS